ncbi:MAG: type II toxin-antitoxin system prevent-host-death family antitoxin [Myxococcales bacterium]|nr:type II toxin-antitoxin system prevent-host-death family antitoxin [Myxococcales bacterium]
MTVVGIRELRQNASSYLRRVEAGETLQIASRGRPVALWVPLPRTGGLDRLRQEMRLTEPEGDLLDLGPPLRPSPGVPLPSASLSMAREHER